MEEWRTLRRKRPLNEERMALYRRVIEADLRAGELRLGELRRRRGVNQTDVADALDVSQPNISRIELQDDVYLSTLARYVAALGGDLEIRAVFADESVPLIPPAPPQAGPPPGSPGPPPAPHRPRD